MSNLTNPNSISLNLDTELGQAIRTLIGQTPYGESTIFIKEFMEKHKDELIALWNSQGKNGNETFEKWFSKWSMTRDEQAEAKARKEAEAFENRRKQYLALNCSDDKAIELATQFPDKDPIDVIKIMSYANQTNLGTQKQNEKEIEALWNLAILDLSVIHKPDRLKEAEDAINKLESLGQNVSKARDRLNKAVETAKKHERIKGSSQTEIEKMND
jgi:hypothetical protein